MDVNNIKKGFSLPELLAVLVILVIILILAINVIRGTLNKTDKVIDADTEKQIINAAEKWSIENSSKFDDIEGKKIQVGLDVVFIIDTSGGMASAMPGDATNKKSTSTINAVNSALDVLSTNELNRVGYVFFSGERATGKSDGPRGDKNASIRYVSTSLDKIGTNRLKMLADNKVQLPDGNSATFTGATYTQLAIQKATQLLSANGEKGRIPAIILVTDGEPSVGLGVTEVTLSNLLNLQNADSGEGTYTWCLDTEVWQNSKNYVNWNTWLASRSFGTKWNSTGTNHRFTYTNTCAKIGYDASLATKRSAILSWNIMQSAELSKDLLKEKYGTETFFYTIGIGLTSHYAEFLLNPNKASYDNLMVGKQVTCTGSEIEKNCLPSNLKTTYRYPNSYTKTEVEVNKKNLELYWDSLWHMNVSEALHKYIKEKHNGKFPVYPTKAFTAATMNVSELNEIFKQITTHITSATKVTEVCITLEDLYNEGYLTKKDIKLSSGDMISNYIIMSTNEATNQYTFSLAKTAEQKQECENYLALQSNSN